jgi:hypothetical protein
MTDELSYLKKKNSICTAAITFLNINKDEQWRDAVLRKVNFSIVDIQKKVIFAFLKTLKFKLEKKTYFRFRRKYFIHYVTCF